MAQTLSFVFLLFRDDWVPSLYKHLAALLSQDSLTSFLCTLLILLIDQWLEVLFKLQIEELLLFLDRLRCLQDLLRLFND